MQRRKRPAAAALAVLLFALSALPAAALALPQSEIDYVLDDDGERLSIPKAYELEEVITDFGGRPLNAAKDLFIDSRDELYIADSGNARIVHLSADHRFVRELTGSGGQPFAEPTGVFVRQDGRIYVADQTAGRVEVLSADGTAVGSIGRPQSELLGDLFEFRPGKVCVSDMNDVYLIMGKSFMTLSEDNEFQGYIGAGTVAFSFKDLIVRLFASAEQKKKLARSEPPAYNEFTVGPNGRIYAVSLGSTDQIKVINSVGNNIYRTGVAYGEQTVGATGSWIIPSMLDPSFADIAVDGDGIITVVDQNNCRLYQYGPDGDLLCVFGGEGSVKGRFEVPSAIAVDSTGRIYVLDSATGLIHVFRPTAFIQTVHSALKLYNDGQYAEAQALWSRVSAYGTGYPLCERGLGDIGQKQKDYTAAMAHYRRIGDRAAYAEAYGKRLHDSIAGHFMLAALSAIGAVLLLIFLVGRLKRRADRYVDELFGIPVGAAPPGRRGRKEEST